MDTAERTLVQETSQTYDAFMSYSHSADGLLAPRLQSGLQRFAKPWWKRRALRVFRDESSLSANPHLWSSITEALDSSGWFVLLLSPDAASSEWVNQEIEYWKQHKDPSRILPVLTDGTLGWNDGAFVGSAAPPSLRGTFLAEPRWVDLRFAHHEEHLDLKNPEFSSAVADIASAVRGIPKDELESEEVRQHRRTIRTAWTAGVLLGVFAIAAIAFAFNAARQSDRAERNAQVAEQNEDTAELEAERATLEALRAQETAEIAELEAERARQAQALARSRELSASAINVLDEDPELSILLALEAIDQAPVDSDVPVEAGKALRQALDNSRLRRTVSTGIDGPVYLDLSPDGERLAVSGADEPVIRVFDSESLDLLWEHRPANSYDGAHFPSISPDGTLVAVPLNKTGEAPSSAVVVIDMTSGDPVTEIPFQDCGSLVFPLSAWYPDGSVLVASNDQACPRPDAATDFWVDFIDTRSWQSVDLIEFEAIPVVHLSERNLMAIGERGFASTNLGGPPTFYDMETRELIPELELDSIVLSKDGSLIAGNVRRGIGLQLIETDSLQRLDVLVGRGAGLPLGLAFSPDNRYLIQSTQGSNVVLWDLATGTEAFVLNRGRGTATVRYDPTREVLYTGQVDGTIKTWDLSNSIVGAESPSQLFPNAWVNADGFDIGEELGAATVIDLSDLSYYPAFFDVETGELVSEGEEIKDGIKGAGWHALPGGRFVIDTFDSTLGQQGPTVVFDPRDGSEVEIVGCHWLFDAVEDDGTHQCLDESFSIPPPDELGTVYGHLVLSIDRSKLAIVGGYTNEGREWSIMDTASLEIIERGPEPDHGGITITFSDDWLLTFDQSHIKASDRETGDIFWRSSPGEFPAQVTENGAEMTKSFEVDRNNRMVAIVDAIGSVHVVDTSTWESWVIDQDLGNIRGMAFHPSGRQLAVFVDGNMEVIDVETGISLHSVPISNPTDGHWLDEEHIVVGTGTGVWTIITTSTEELVEIARARQPRSFTENECAQYGIDPCPTSGLPEDD